MGDCTTQSQHWGRRDMNKAAETGDRIGMLLDLDAGTTTVFKNDVCLGVMATGLSGEYCWAVSLEDEDDSVRVDSAPIPPAPTPEELATVHSDEDGESGSDGE